MCIELNAVNFQYGKRQVLHDLTFSLTAGSFNALLGPNGAGKTTLISLLTRLLALQSGSIKIHEDDLRQAPRRIMASLGVVFQQSTLDLDLSVLHNLEYHGALHGLSRQQVKSRALEELARMGLSDRLNDKVRSLNGGHRRRVEIARALLHRPKVLLLDEPSVGLDTRTRLELNEYVRGLCQTHALTLLWTTHLMDEIRPEDHLLVLNKGHLLFADTGTQLLSLTQTHLLSDAFEQITGLRETVI